MIDANTGGMPSLPLRCALLGGGGVLAMTSAFWLGSEPSGLVAGLAGLGGAALAAAGCFWQARRQRDLEELNRLTAEHQPLKDSPDIWLNTLDREGRVVTWNRAAERISGYSASEVVGRADIWRWLYPDENYRQYVCTQADDILSQGSVAFDLVTTIRAKDGRQVMLSWNSRRLMDASGDCIGSIALARDVTLERRAQEAMRLHASVFESVDPIAITSPEGVVLKVNRAFCRLFGQEARHVIGRTLQALHRGERGQDPYEQVWRHLKQADEWSDELNIRSREGAPLPVHLSVSTVRDEEGRITHYVVHWRDISKRKAYEEQIRRQALYDPLTGLPNRRMVVGRLEQEMGRARRIQGYGALLFLDLDRFKQINDTHGHSVGDALLKHLSQRLLGVLRAEDTAARLGGDEFVVLLGAEAGPRDEAASRARRVGDKILSVLREPVTVGDYTLSVSASAGLALYPGDQLSAEQLMQKADSAMYLAKEEGRDTLYFFSDAVQAKVDHRQVIHNELRQAVDQDQLLLHFQPITSADGELHAVEALLRWQQPEALPRLPAEFIAVAEQTGLIAAIDVWVIREACQQLVTWQQQGLFPAGRILALNISAQLLMLSDFAERVEQILAQTGAPGDAIVLDVNESLLNKDMPGLEAAMQAVGRHGVRFAVDDFARGHCSLVQLQRLPIRALKLSEYFVAGLPDDDTAVAIVDAALGMARSLGLDVVAKGVENAQQLAALQARACRYFQGYHISPPVTAGRMTEMLSAGYIPL